MIHWCRRLGVAALLIASASTPVRADGSRLWTVCGGDHSTFNTCAAVQVDVIGTLVSMRVMNLSGLFGSAANYVFTRIGLDNIPGVTAGSLVSMSGPTRAGDTPASWKTYNDVVNGGGINVDFGLTNGNGVRNGIASACAPAGSLPGGQNQLWMTNTPGCSGGYAIANAAVNGGWVHFQFNVNQTFDPNAAGTVLYVKAQNGGPGGGASTNCITGPNGNCAPVILTPEPLSLTLLATGLFGVGGAAARRRRRRAQDVEGAA